MAIRDNLLVPRTPTKAYTPWGSFAVSGPVSWNSQQLKLSAA